MSVPDVEMLINISEILNVSVSDLLGKEIQIGQDKSSLDTIAIEFEKLNELIVSQQVQRKKFKNKVMKALGIIILVLLVAAIYEKWNEIFYEFGQNVYRWLH